MKTILAIILACFCFIKANGSASYNFLFDTNAVAQTNAYQYYGSEQGVFNDGTNLFFNDTFNLWYFGATNLSGTNTVVITIGNSTNYGGLTYDHLGDSDFYNGKVYVPVFGSVGGITNNAIGVFSINYAASNFTMLSITSVTNDLPVEAGLGISAVAVDAPRGLIYALDFAVDPVVHPYNSIAAYSLSDFHFVKKIQLSQPVQEIQGAKVVNGVLILLADMGTNGVTTSNAQFWAVAPDTGSVRFLGSQIDLSHESEGLDAWGTNLIWQGGPGGDYFYFDPITISPILAITYSGNSVKVSWPSVVTGFVLQQTSDLTTTNWATSGYIVSDDDTNKNITITSPTENLFFRLAHQ